jgi:hypothetical protein
MQNFIMALRRRDSRSAPVAETPFSFAPPGPLCYSFSWKQRIPRVRAPRSATGPGGNSQGLQKNLFKTKAKGVKQ